MKYIQIFSIFIIFPLYLFAASPSAHEELDLGNSIAKQGDLYYEEGHYITKNSKINNLI